MCEKRARILSAVMIMCVQLYGVCMVVQAGTEAVSPYPPTGSPQQSPAGELPARASCAGGARLPRGGPRLLCCRVLGL